ncbi:MAG: hypothetical protein KDK71_01325, partial [Chlamydiia bacterium]|nr:hypothetical protein [Chlamydiia bacterium]
GVELTFEKENGLKRQLETLLLENSKEDLERLKEELNEWDQLSYIEGEEETLFEEYKTLASSKETADSLLTVQQGLEEGSLFDTLAQLQKIAKDKTLKEQLGQALFHLQEASFTLSKQLDAFENSPEKLTLIDDRLKTISRLKKKNHLTSSEIPSHIEALKSRIDILENLDQTIEETKRALKETSEKALASARHLSKKRQEVGALLSKALEKELRSLNFPHAEAPIDWREKPLGPTGIDEVSFLLSANKGEPPASLKNQTSGGELARYLLALKILLGTKGGLPTLIFDEIDANIGGETARIVGEKLKTLGGHTQILAITHFPQVARSADHHLHIAKSEKEGRTSATIAPLTATERDTELLRMLGASQHSHS